MEERRRIEVGVLAERLKAVQDDVVELRQQFREDHHRLRNTEAAVSKMLEAQNIARESERRQYARLANSIQVGMFALAAATLALAVVTILLHTG